MHIARIVLSISLTLFMCSQAICADLQVKLNTQIELLPSCRVNDQQYIQGSTGLNFGELNFGNVSANFKGILDTTLSNGSYSLIKIQCNGSAAIKLIFGSGENDNKIPNNMQENYFRALSNGEHYIAYNLLYGADRKKLKPNDVLTFNTDQDINVDLYGKAILQDQVISNGRYRDIIRISIEF